DGVGRAGRRHIDDRSVGAGRLTRFRHRIEDGQAEMRLATLAGRGAADDLGAIGERLLGMESTVLAGETLGDDAGLGADENGHQALPLTASTIFRAASSRSSADTTLRPDSAMICLPSSTLVPSRRTTSGTSRPTALTAAMTPRAITSQRMMPPK